MRRTSLRSSNTFFFSLFFVQSTCSIAMTFCALKFLFFRPQAVRRTKLPQQTIGCVRAFLTKKIAATVAAIGRVSIFAQTASSRCRKLPDY